jgi:hypothetical protein
MNNKSILQYCICLLLSTVVLSLASCQKEKKCHEVIIFDNQYNTVEALHTYFSYCHRSKDEIMQRVGDTIWVTGFFDETHFNESLMQYDQDLSRSRSRELSDKFYEAGEDVNHKYIHIEFRDSIRRIPSSFRKKRVYIVSRFYYDEGGHKDGNHAKMTSPPYYAFIPLYMDTVPDIIKTSAL